MVLKIKGGDRDGFIKPVLSTDRDVLHHQCHHGAAGFMSVGAYVGAMLSLKAELPIVVGILVGGLVASLVAVIIGLPTTRLKGLYLAISTLGFGEVVRVIFLNLDVTNGALVYLASLLFLKN